MRNSRTRELKPPCPSTKEEQRYLLRNLSFFQMIIETANEDCISLNPFIKKKFIEDKINRILPISYSVASTRVMVPFVPSRMTISPEWKTCVTFWHPTIAGKP